MQRAWFANLDADLELSTAGHYHASKKIEQQVKAQHAAIARLTLGERLLDREVPAQLLEPMPGVVLCWSPTPSALRWLAARGAVTPAAPPLSVLQRVNHRHFVFELAELPGRTLVDVSNLALLETSPPNGAHAWRLKRPFGFAGKGQRVIHPPTTPDDRRWLADSVRAGPLLCEPNYDLEAEFTAHGYVDRQGLIAGGICQQQCDAWGQVSSIELVDVAEGIAHPLHLMRERLAEALWNVGYWGPFGFDAFLYRGANGPCLNLLSDVNARFSLGWSIGLGLLREKALGRASE